jgi:DNA ligase D-like protein (predicted 3'-phosphoesterase)
MVAICSGSIVYAGDTNMPGKKISTLSTYRSKRSFDRSPEPRGKSSKKSKKPIFVVQKHAASHLHYDVRLEIGKVLVSWAVPKGPSTNPSIKRLAIETEDHPMEYATFEGVIPEGEYGGGTVMVWDIGTFKNIKKDDGKPVSLKKSFERGTIEVFLIGEKLHGGYAFIKTKRDNQWLLIKMKDEYADTKDTILKSRPKSAISERTMQEIKKEEAKTSRMKKRK